MVLPAQDVVAVAEMPDRDTGMGLAMAIQASGAFTRFSILEELNMGPVLEAAQKAGLRVKINTVALKGFNEDELFTLTEWCAAQDHDLTFIEVMPMGDMGEEDRVGQYWSLSDLRNRLSERYTLTELSHRTGGPARYMEIGETGQQLGFITPLTLPHRTPSARTNSPCPNSGAVSVPMLVWKYSWPSVLPVSRSFKPSPLKSLITGLEHPAGTTGSPEPS